ncbi:hypothetical protein [Robertmurraya sp. Marseille-Q9965]
MISMLTKQYGRSKILNDYFNHNKAFLLQKGKLSIVELEKGIPQQPIL